MRVDHVQSVPPSSLPVVLPPPRLIPVPQWPEHHPWPSVAGLRWMIFNAQSNGFQRVIRRVGRRVGRRVLIDERAFFTWVESQGSEDPQVMSRPPVRPAKR